MDFEYFGHSTDIASKAADKIYDSTKQERLVVVVVKMPDYGTTAIAEMMYTIHDHVDDTERE